MQNPSTNIVQTSLNGGKIAPVATVATEFVLIRVRRDLLLPIPTTATNPPPAASQHSPGHLYLIEGRLEDIRQFSGTTVDWVIRVAHLICDPLGTGQVFTHTTGTTSDWYASDRAASWRQVFPGDPLHSGIYEFESASPILLSEISDRNNSESGEEIRTTRAHTK